MSLLLFPSLVNDGQIKYIVHLCSPKLRSECGSGIRKIIWCFDLHKEGHSIKGSTNVE